MSIDWYHFSLWPSLGGGLLLGLATAAFILLEGRVLGLSSILDGALRPVRGDFGWRAALLAGLLTAPMVWGLFAAPVPARFEAGPIVIVGAGLLVGWGTARGSGCTSGHGVCGLARLSPRSVVATLSFMAMGFVVVFVSRHLIGSAP